jgi:long-chain acyl-CoA synthetase
MSSSAASPEPAGSTISALLWRNAEDHPTLPALSWLSEDGWQTQNWSQARARVLSIASALATLGVGYADRVLLKMPIGAEHWLSDLALLHLGAVPISVYETASIEQVAFIARSSRARLAVVDGATAEHWDNLLGGRIPLERLVVVGDHPLHVSFTQLTGESHTAECTWRSLSPNSPLTIVYTSGTTNDPKAILVTQHGALLGAESIARRFDLPPHTEHLAHLTFAHMAGRMLGLYIPLLRAEHVYLWPDPRRVFQAVRDFHPSMFCGVPRVWEKFAAAAEVELARIPPNQRDRIDHARAVSREHFTYLEQGKRPPPRLARSYSLVKEGILDPLLAPLGLDRLLLPLSTGAPLPMDVVRFWASLGVLICDSYGLSETTVAVSCGVPSTYRPGSSGRPLDGVEARCAEDGEILVSSPFLADGYAQADGSTTPLGTSGGWFATGDTGRIDPDGYLWINGRKKELIVTSTGRNVSPALVEAELTTHPMVGHALAYGDGRSYLVALIVLDPEVATSWVAGRGITGSIDDISVHPDLLAEVERAVLAANARLNNTEQIRRYQVIAQGWSVEGGELTPTMKVKRHLVTEKYASEIEDLYANP